MLLQRQLCIFASVLFWLSMGVKGQCSKGWSGNNCMRRNIAYGLSDSECGTSSMVAGGNCTLLSDEDESTGISTQRQQNPFLWLKLSEISTIYFLKVVTTGTYQYDLWGFRIVVSNSDDFMNAQYCYQNSGLYKTEHIITCGTALVGQYIKIEIPTYINDPKTLSLQELQIYNCQSGYYGQDCSSPCGNCQPNRICDITFGACPSGCVSPFTGAQCKDCLDGYYGERCNIKCGHCIGDKCEKDTGNCRSGCNGNYDGPMCIECVDGFYGQSCSQSCGNCLNSAACDKIYGQCLSGCTFPFQGYYCKDCPDGNHGEQCDKKCGHCAGNKCNKDTGNCPSGCIGNYYSPKCTECVDGFYGQSCSQSCGNCLNSAACDKIYGQCLSGCTFPFRGYYCKDCPDGNHGEQCDKKCGHCAGNKCNKDTGNCPSGCIGNYYSPKCTDCKSGFHGSDCTLTCGHCKFRRCYMSSGFCNSGCINGYFGNNCDGVCGNCGNLGSCGRYTEICFYGCKPGYTGDKCRQECENGNYGQNCAEECGNCLNDAVCNKTNGHCPSGCKPGFVESECKAECPDKFYGSGCSTPCGQCQGSDICDKVNGSCPAGCQDGYSGDLCSSECPNNTYGTGCGLNCGYCVNSETCNSITGMCASGCKDGYEVPFCKNVCRNGFYGSNCGVQCGFCLGNETCNNEDGTCAKGCLLGHSPPYCTTECQNNTYGLDCKNTCHCNNNTQCDVSSGDCGSIGCASGFKGDACQEALRAEDDTQLGVAIPVGVSAAVLCLIIIAALLYRSKRRKSGFRTNRAANEDEVSTSDSTSEISLHDIDTAMEPREDVVYANSGSHAVSPTLLDISELENHVDKVMLEDSPFGTEYKKLPQGLIRSVDEATKEHNVVKCRYRKIVPYDETRVVLELTDEDETTDFINASYINGVSNEREYIASQGTTTYNIKDFWRMIWQEQVGKIVMVSKLAEDGKEKVLQYWPESGAVQYGDIIIETTNTKFHVDYCTRSFRVKKGSHVRNVKQLHFCGWPDHGVPKDTPGLIEFRNRVNTESSKLNGPILVHCSAGVGRTGTLIAFDIIMKRLEKESQVDVFATVAELRSQRTLMVQSLVQYAFLYRIVCDAYITHNALLTLEDRKKQHILENILNRMSKRQVRDVKNADEEASTRIWLSAPAKGGGKYYNATSLPVDRANIKMYATAIPKKGKILDFWRMVYELKNVALVLLDEAPKFAQYFPKDNAPMKIGPFQISLEDVDEFSEFLSIRNLSLKYSENETQNVSLFCFTGWSKGSNKLPSRVHLTAVKNRISQWEGQNEQGAIVLQCKDGCSRCCLYGVCDFILEALKTNRSANVILAAKRFRSVQPAALKTLESFRFCYEMPTTYMDTAHTYANAGFT